MMQQTDRVSISLPVEQWNQVLAFVQEAPWRVANPLMVEMLGQLQAASNPTPAPPLVNGHDHAEQADA